MITYANVRLSFGLNHDLSLGLSLGPSLGLNLGDLRHEGLQHRRWNIRVICCGAAAAPNAALQAGPQYRHG